MPKMYLNAFGDQAPPRSDDGGAFALPQAPSRNGGPYYVNVILLLYYLLQIYHNFLNY